MILGVSVTKSVQWRNATEEFTNVWHFDTAVDMTSQALANNVVSSERGFFGANVNFKKVQVWGPTDGTKQQSQMLLQQDLTGSGSGGTSTVCALETSAVVSWDTGRKNTRGGRIFLRKYLHMGQLAVADEPAAKGNTVLPAGELQRIKDFGAAMKNPSSQNSAPICDKAGRRLPLLTPTVVLPHLHTRQFRR